VPDLAWRTKFRRKAAVLGLTLLVFIAVVAMFGPHLAPYDPLQINPDEALSPPSWKYLFGTDQFGRDILSRTIVGTRLSIIMGVGAVVIALAIGLVVGLASGLLGGWTELLLMNGIDMMMAFPSILLALTVVAVLGQGTVNVAVAVGVSMIPSFARLLRADVLSAKENAYVEAARALGTGELRLAVRDILPNVVAPLIVLSTVAIAWSIIVAASLSFLGLGPPTPTPEWGVDLSNGRSYLLRGWWIATAPGMCITLTVVAVNLVGDSLRDFLDPRLRSLASL
jgi:ABC-type dipeptide/oligopeptide/nickel transport system permease subunit